jgi:hypothetical protein
MESLFKDLLKTLTKHSHILSALSSTMINHSILLKTMMNVCLECETNIATVKHVKHQRQFCDSCAARDIVSKSDNEINWVDLEAAEQIRHLMVFVQALNENTQTVKLH